MTEEQKLREIADILADIFTAGGESHEVGGQSFDQLKQSGYIDRKISDLTALISEGYYPKEFVKWTFRQRFMSCGHLDFDSSILDLDLEYWHKHIKGKENEQ